MSADRPVVGHPLDTEARPEPATPGSGLEVREVVVAYDGRTVLDRLSLSVPRGETLAVLGPSGGGKTTLLRAVAGLVHPSEGRIVLDRRDMTEVPTHRRGIGLVFQDHALWPHRDVAANVGFGLRVAGMDRSSRARRVAEVLDLVGLAGYERRRITELSGGEAQRVALARSLAPNPAVLLLDEPLGALDRLLHRRLVADLGSIIEQTGLTAVHVTHDHSEALALGDRVAVLSGGRLLQLDRPEVLWRVPVSEEVARFLGHRTILDVEVRGALAFAGSTPVVPVDAPDGRGRLVVRDEAIRLVHPADGTGRTGPLHAATVTEAAFVGDATELELRVDGWADGPIRLHTRVSGRAPATGTRVDLRLDPAGCSLLR